MMNWTYFYKEAIGLFAIVDPVGLIPFFLVTTASWSIMARRKVAWFASLLAGCILLFFAFLGTKWLDFFGVSIASFMVGGGLLLLLIAIDYMLGGTDSKMKVAIIDGEDVVDGNLPKNQIDLAVFPFAIPMLAGPAAISHVVIQSSPPTLIPLWVVLLAIIMVILLSGLVLSLASLIRDLIGEIGMSVVTRLMGLMLSAIAIETITHGLVQLLPGLGLSVR